jgi:hypothetical protein
MELADITAALANAENIPVLGGIVHDLRECVQIMTEIPVNSQVFTDQATDLGNIFSDGTKLANELNNTLNELRQTGKWQGPAADDYLGPSGSRGPSSGAGGQLALNMHQILGTIKANQLAHTNSENFINEVNVLQIVLWGEVVVAVVTVLAIIAATASVVGAPADAGLVPAAGVETAAATGTAGTIVTMTTTTTTLSTSVEAVIAQAEAQLTAAYAMQAVSGMLTIYGSVLAADVGLALIEITLVSNGDQGTPTPFNATTDPLTPDQEAEIQRILTKYPWASRSYVEWLVRQGYSEANIEKYLEILQPVLPGSWADFEELVQEFPGDAEDIAYLLRAGFTKDQIRQILNTFTPSQRAALINRIATAVKNGHDAFGLSVTQLHDLVTHILNDLNSSDPDQRLEGQKALLLIATVIGVEVWTPHTRYDIQTANSIVEVSNGDGTEKGKQLRRYITDDTAHKPIVLYLPNAPWQSAQNFANLATQTDKSLGVSTPVYVVTKNGVWMATDKGWKQITGNKGKFTGDPNEMLNGVLNDIGEGIP